MVSGLRLFTSRPQASPVCNTAVPEITRAVVPTPARNCRRSKSNRTCLLVIAFPPCWRAVNPPLRSSRRSGSAITPVLLQNLDLVAVRILYEEEARHQRAVAKEFLDRSGRKALHREVRMLGGQIINCDCQMAVAVAEAIRIMVAVIDRQLDLKIGLGVAQVNEREIRKAEAVCDAETEGALVEIDRTRLVDNAEHHVDRFGHRLRSPGQSFASGPPADRLQSCCDRLRRARPL